MVSIQHIVLAKKKKNGKSDTKKKSMIDDFC